MENNIKINDPVGIVIKKEDGGVISIMKDE